MDLEEGTLEPTLIPVSMWQMVFTGLTLGSIFYLFSKWRHVPETQYQLYGSGPWRHSNNSHLQLRERDIHRTVQGCKGVLKSTWREEDFARWADKMTLLETRAGPNLRLADSFGIENSFTTIDEGYHKVFKAMITKALKTDEEEWRMLWIISNQFVNNNIAKQEQDEDIQLVSLVQSVVFKTVLLKFFPDDSNLDEDAAIANITRLINTIWMDSKRSRYMHSAKGALSTWRGVFDCKLSVNSNRRNLAALKTNLACVLPNRGWNDPGDSPLNIILPAYETLWRVVFHCTIEVLFRHSGSNTLWKDCITKFGQTLDGEGDSLLHTKTVRRISTLDIVNEALRLYPPTKRIYRWEQRENEHGTLNEHSDLCAADIEAVHRDNQIWGPNPLLFDPGRWPRYSSSERERAMESFIPFGYGGLSCPAKGDFAPRMIALLVAALVKGLEHGFECIAELEEDRVDGEGPLRTERDSYETLKLRRL